jgi:class 3 adenylate cyclase
MEPRIQYAKSSDGVSIAYWVMGSGLPFVVMPLRPSSHIQAEWRLPKYRALYESQARNRQLIRYDGRGTGLSDRDVTQFSLDADILDLEAVVGRLGLRRFALHAIGAVGGAAITYAAQSQERVSRLILLGCSAQGARYAIAPLFALLESDYVLYTETSAHYTLGLNREETRAWAAFMRECATQSTARALLGAYADYDATSLLQAVQAPTLILHPKGSPIDIAASRDIAAGIRGARLVVLEGSFGVVFDAEDRAGYRAAVDEFLGLETQKVAQPSGMTAILFADIVDSTALTERLGDAAFRDKARDLDATLRAVIRDHAGTPIEGRLLGDGVLAVFTSARQAIEAALACASAGGHAGLPLHLGLHAGDVIREDNNVYGGAVNIASRISGLSAPGEVLVSETVRSLARTSAGVQFEDRGEQALKGVGEAVRVWAVRTGE